MNRFLDAPIVVSLETDYRNWKYEPMTLTICSEFINDTALDQIVFNQLANASDSKQYENLRHFFEVIAAINGENIKSIDQFKDIDYLNNFTGDDLLRIAKEVISLCRS